MLVFIAPCVVYSQNTEDSLKISLSIATSEYDVEKSINSLTRLANIYDKLKNTEKLIEVNNLIGNVYKNLGAHFKAAEYYKNSYEIADSLNDYENCVLFLDKTAESFFVAEDYAKAELYYSILYDKVYELYSESNYAKIKVSFNLSETYKKQARFNKALKYNIDILELYSAMADTNAMSVVSNNIGYVYLHLKDYRAALISFKNSLEYGVIASINELEYAKLYSNIAICHQNSGDIDNTLINLKLALKKLKESDNYSEKARLENITANIYHNDKDLHNAEQFSRYSIESARKSDDKNLLQICYRTYSQILRDGNDYVTALEYYEKHLSLKDSILFEQRIKDQSLNQRIINLEKAEKDLKLKLADEEVKDLALKQLRLEAEKREKELELLRSEKELEQSEKDRLQQSLQIAKQNHEAEIRERELKQLEQDKAIQDLVLKQKEAEEKERQKEIELLESEKEKQQMELEKEAEAKKRAQWMFALLAVIVVLIFIGLIVTHKKNVILAKQKLEIEYKNRDLELKNEEILTQSERIVQQKDLIEKKNEEITDSIHYASRIQNAVLPSIEVMGNYLSDYFIFFKPKDIVSGDFYWAAEKNDKLIVAAVDCTGHGVPGAFMSMLGMSFLNEIVLKDETIEADKILNELRSEVIKSLKQSGKENEAKDGMDISLCVIDKKNMKMQFAGANNPMYIVRNGELEKFKPDRMPIGYHFRLGNDFSKQDLELKSNDIIYIFSDGYADQFGGENGKKLKYKPFQDLLFDIHSKSMDIQKDKLDKFFSNWRGDYEQIDDVLVIGMRI